MLIKRTRWIKEEYEVEASVVVVRRVSEYCGMSSYSSAENWCLVKNFYNDIEKAKIFLEEYKNKINNPFIEVVIKFLTEEEIEKIKKLY